MSGYLYLPNTAGNYASSPDAPVLDVTGDIDVRALVASDDYSPAVNQVLVSKMGSSTKRSWRLCVYAPLGKIFLQWTEDGSALLTAVSTAGTSFADGVKKWIRVTFDVDNGAGGYDAKFWTSDDGAAWTQLGATVTGGATTSIASTTGGIEIGSYATGLDPFGGGVYRVQIFDGIDGTLVFDADFGSLTASEVAAGSFAESSANAATVTINGAAQRYVWTHRPRVAGPGQLLMTGRAGS